jgi:PAS domain S-box-containing protein
VAAPRTETVTETLAEADLRLLERLGAGVAVVDPADKVVHWSDEAARLFGTSAAEAMGRHWSECVTLIRGDESGGATTRVEITQLGGWHGPVRVRTRAGQELWLRAHIQSLHLPQFGDKPGVAAIFWEGSGPDRAVSGPEAAQLPYRDFFRQSPAALFLTDLDGKIIDATEMAAQLLGVHAADLIGSNLASFLASPATAQLDQDRSELEASGSILRYASFRRPTGDPFPVEIIVSLAVPDPRGLVLVRMRDRTVEEKMERLSGELAQLTQPGESLPDIEDLAQRVVETVASIWGAGASLALLDDSEDTAPSEAWPDRARRILAADAGLAQASLVELVRGSDVPFALDLSDSRGWARRTRKLGFTSLWATPLWHDARRIGSMVLFWAGDPPALLNAPLVEQLGLQAGSAIGRAATTARQRQEAEALETLADSARIGDAVVEQMTDAIITTDAEGLITALNPAGEHLYGLSEEEVVGRPIVEVLEQLRLDGSPLGSEATSQAVEAGYWHGRVVHRPLIGSRAGEHLVVELSLTALRDDRQANAGLIAMSREVTASANLESEAAALGSLAVATGRARSRREVADVALERLCEATMADVGLIMTWGDAPDAASIIEASRGLGAEFLELARTVEVPALGPLLEQPGVVIPFECLAALVEGTELASAFAQEGLATGFLVDLRTLDQSIGLLALAARNPAWGRPSDAVILQAAAQVAGALENARLMERLERGLEEEKRLTAQLEALVGLTQLPQGEIEESSVARFLLDRIIASIGANGGLVVRTSGAGGFRVVASLGVPPAMLAVLTENPASHFPFWRQLAANPQPRAFREFFDHDDAGRRERRMAAQGVTSYAAFPIADGDRAMGAFICFFATSAGSPQPVDDRTIDAVGRIISIAYSNVRMSEGLNEAAERERRLTDELRALQELTLLGAATDDLGRLAQETIEAVVVSTGASGGGYVLVDAAAGRLDPIVWVGQSSHSLGPAGESTPVPTEWPSLEHLQSESGVWLSGSAVDATSDGASTPVFAQAVLPLRVDGKLAGALNLEWSGAPRAEQFDERFLEPIARICSTGLANFRLRSELLHRAAAQRALGHRLATLDELTRIGEEASSFEELAHRTVSLVRAALGASGVCYLLMEPGHHFETHAVAGETGAFRQWLKGLPVKDAPGGSILLTGGNSVLGNFAAGQVNERVLPLAQATGFHSFGAIPIRTGEELAGVLLCFFEQPADMLPVDENALDSVARIGGIALANFRLRARLVLSEERYRTLFEESPDALFVSALDGTVLDANEAAVSLYRVNRGEILGRYFGQLVDTNEREMARRRQIVWAQGRGTFKDRGRRPDGSEFPVQIEVRVVELGGQRRFLSLVRDLSDQERLTGELVQAQKMEAIGSLVSGVAHELNNPLAAIIAFSQLLLGDARLPDDMKHDAGLLVQEADRTRRIVQGLLDFARQRPPERRRASIAALVRSVLELQSYALSTNQIQVVEDIPVDLPEVDLDRAQMQQVLLNLTINAIQAIRTRVRPGPSHLWVSAALVAGDRSGDRSSVDGAGRAQPRVRITIRDDGPGVPEDARDKLFLPFFTTKQPGEGTGLGLSVSFGIVAAHGGLLWYEPGPANVGSCFIVELPVGASPAQEPRPAEPHPEVPAQSTARPADGTRKPARAGGRRQQGPRSSPAQASAAPADAEGHDRAGPATAGPGRAGPAARPVPAAARAAASLPSRCRVLALDDELSIRAFLRKVLALSGMDCDAYQDGAQALEGLRHNSYDAMLIDHRMAGMSGKEFYEAATELRPELVKRAVFMSGDVLNPDLRGFATERGIRLLAKPFDIDAVTRVVREVMSEAEGPGLENR